SGPVRSEHPGHLTGAQVQVHPAEQGRRGHPVGEVFAGQLGHAQVVDGGAHHGLAAHVLLLVRSSSQANTGAPIAAVRMPTGTSEGAKKERAPVSAQSRNTAPTSAATGSSRECRAP